MTPTERIEAVIKDSFLFKVAEEQCESAHIFAKENLALAIQNFVEKNIVGCTWCNGGCPYCNDRGWVWKSDSSGESTSEAT